MEFSASHRLWCADWSEQRNREVFGAAARPVSHGHDYALEVTVRGAVDDHTGMLIDLGRLKDVMEAEIAARFDHRDLNDDTPYFRDCPPTAENFSQLIFDLLARALPEGLIDRVRLAPTQDLCVEVRR